MNSAFRSKTLLFSGIVFWATVGFAFGDPPAAAAAGGGAAKPPSPPGVPGQAPAPTPPPGSAAAPGGGKPPVPPPPKPRLEDLGSGSGSGSGLEGSGSGRAPPPIAPPPPLPPSPPPSGGSAPGPPQPGPPGGAPGAPPGGLPAPPAAPGGGPPPPPGGAPHHGAPGSGAIGEGSGDMMAGSGSGELGSGMGSGAPKGMVPKGSTPKPGATKNLLKKPQPPGGGQQATGPLPPPPMAPGSGMVPPRGGSSLDPLSGDLGSGMSKLPLPGQQKPPAAPSPAAPPGVTTPTPASGSASLLAGNKAAVDPSKASGLKQDVTGQSQKPQQPGPMPPSGSPGVLQGGTPTLPPVSSAVTQATTTVTRLPLQTSTILAKLQPSSPLPTMLKGAGPEQPREGKVADLSRESTKDLSKEGKGDLSSREGKDLPREGKVPELSARESKDPLKPDLRADPLKGDSNKFDPRTDMKPEVPTMEPSTVTTTEPLKPAPARTPPPANPRMLGGPGDLVVTKMHQRLAALQNATKGPPPGDTMVEEPIFTRHHHQMSKKHKDGPRHAGKPRPRPHPQQTAGSLPIGIGGGSGPPHRPFHQQMRMRTSSPRPPPRSTLPPHRPKHKFHTPMPPDDVVLAELIEVVPIFAKMRDVPGRGHYYRELNEEKEYRIRNTRPLADRVRVNAIDGPGEDTSAVFSAPTRQERVYFKRLERRRRQLNQLLQPRWLY